MATYTTTRKKIRSEVNSQVYTGPHNGLAGRDAANAHPIQSITGLEVELASIQSHIGDVDIHYAMNQISITESQISDLQAYLPLAGGTVDFLDVTNNLTVGGEINAGRIYFTTSQRRVRPASGNWGSGFDFRNNADDGSEGYIGAYGTPVVDRLMITYGASPWSSGLGLYVKPNGNTGVGKINPAEMLDVGGSATIDNNLTVGGDTILSALAGGGTRTLKIDNNGKVFAE